LPFVGAADRRVRPRGRPPKRKRATHRVARFSSAAGCATAQGGGYFFARFLPRLLAFLAERFFVAFLAERFFVAFLAERFFVAFLADFLAPLRFVAFLADFFAPFFDAFFADRFFVAFLAERFFVAFLAAFLAPAFLAVRFFAVFLRGFFCAGVELGAIIDIMSAIIVWFSCLGFQ
jgi:hypothetical protein